MERQGFAYKGCDNLEAMSHAVNYNKYLIENILLYLSPKHNTKVLDFGAGKGIYAGMIQKECSAMVDCLEPDKRLQRELKDRGHKVYESIGEIKQKYDPSSMRLMYLNI